MSNFGPIERDKDGEFFGAILAYSKGEDFSGLRGVMSQRIYTAKETETSYRVLNHWESLGILPLGVISGEGTWRKFSFPELVWNKIVSRMRNFGLPLERIAEANTQIMDWDAKLDMYASLEVSIITAWTTPIDIYVVVFNEGGIYLATAEEIERHKIKHGSQDKLLISLKGILSEIGLRVEESEVLVALNPAEMEVIKEIRRGENAEIFIKVNKEGMVSHISGKSLKIGKTKLSDMYKSLRDSKAYGSLNIEFENGVPQFIKIEKKRKLKT